MSETSAEEGSKQITDCAVCGEPVHAGIEICPKCGKYQSRWRNELNYFVSVAGLAGIVGGALTFVGSALVDAFADRGPGILAFRSDRVLAVVNPSKHPLAVKQAIVSYSADEHETFDVYAEVEPSKIGRIEFKASLKADEQEYFVCRNHQAAAKQLVDPGSRFQRVFFEVADPDYAKISAAFARGGGALAVSDCNLRISYSGYSAFGGLRQSSKESDCRVAIKVKIDTSLLPSFADYFCSMEE